MTRSVALAALLVLAVSSLAQANGPLAALGYHMYLPSPYLEQLPELMDKTRLNSPCLELGVGYQPFPRLHLEAALNLAGVRLREKAGNARLDLTLTTHSVVLSADLKVIELGPFMPFIGGGVSAFHQRADLEYTTSGQLIEGGLYDRHGMGVHCRAGIALRLSPRWQLTLWDRLSWAPLPGYARSGRMFDVGGNYICLGVLFNAAKPQ